MTSDLQVLLIEDDDEHARIISRHIRSAQNSMVRIERENRLQSGLEKLSRKPFDVVLLDLRLPDGNFNETLPRTLQIAPHVPVVVLSSIEDRDLAIKLVHEGAGDYLCKTDLSTELLIRSIYAVIERKHLQEALQARIEELNEAHRRKDEFLAILSHELRTPLNAIIGFIDLIKTMDPGSSDFSRALEIIERNARAESQLVSDVLEMSQIITGKMKIEKKYFSLAELLESTIESMSFAMQNKNIHILKEIHVTTPYFLGDESRLRQVLWNLMSNAVKFTKAGGQIKITLQQRNHYFEIQFRDNGAGIAPENLPHVFERFWQEDASMTRPHGGLGLGLSIVRHLVEMHGGTVSVYSEGEGKGCTFTVHLPQQEAEVA